MSIVAQLVCALAVATAGAGESDLVVDRGYVIADGKYLAPPYHIGGEGAELVINGTKVRTDVRPQAPQTNRHPANRYQASRPQANREAQRRRPARRVTGAALGQRRLDVQPAVIQSTGEIIDWPAAVADTLRRGGLVIATPGQQPQFLFGSLANDILNILASQQSPTHKVEALVELNGASRDPADWRPLVKRFRVTDDLRTRLAGWNHRSDPAAMIQPVSTSAWIDEGNQPSGWSRYGITVTAMMLGVFALGTLLTHRPQSFIEWAKLNPSPEAMTMVVHCVGLLVVLGLFDLGLTVWFGGSAGFVELNPLGDAALANPLALTGMKVVSLLFGAAMLLTLRRYRGAQAAAWWLCLLTTVLTFRWTVFSSMFVV